ncbi:MAG TPA: glycosyltransferase family A protein [Polyangia bacterium]|nr:glycosyltransferase family A protein [Polyangia bacterium]
MTNGSDILVSVVIPAYNAAEFIRQSVSSALDQSLRSIEVIVIDDGSAERVDWITELDPARVRYHWKTNGGPSSARNAGARLARGDLLAFLDADDLWAPGKLQRQADALAARPRAAFAYGAFDGIDEQGRPLPRPLRHRPSGDIAEALFMYNFVTTSSVVVRRALFDEMGGFDESLVWSEDYDLWMRLVERYEAVCIEGIAGSYRMNSQGLSRNFARLYETERLVIDRAVARKARPEFARRLRQRLGQFHFEFGYDYFRARRFADARHQLSQSVRQWPFNRRAWVYWLRATLAGS